MNGSDYFIYLLSTRHHVIADYKPFFTGINYIVIEQEKAIYNYAWN